MYRNPSAGGVRVAAPLVNVIESRFTHSDQGVPDEQFIQSLPLFRQTGLTGVLLDLTHISGGSVASRVLFANG